MAANAAALDKYLAKMEKTFGAGVINAKPKTTYDVIPTGSLGLDRALGVGGWPLGRIVEIWGPESAGKSTVLHRGQANAQLIYPDRWNAVIDMEQTFDSEWAKKNGLNTDHQFHHVVPDNAEDVADILKEMLESCLYASIVIDSIGNFVNRSEFEKDAGESVMGKTPQIITRMNKIAAVNARKAHTSVQYINQVRANLGYGADTVQAGPWSTKHITSARVKLRRGTEKYEIGSAENKVQYGYSVVANVEKNKMGPEKLVAKWTYFNQASEKWGPIGIDQVEEAFTLGVQFGAINKRGGWYDIDGESINGGEKVVEYLRGKPSVVNDIREFVIDNIKGDVKDDGPLPAETS